MPIDRRNPAVPARFLRRPKAALLLLATFALGLGALRASAQPASAQVALPFVAHLDWQRYGGRWYEVARLPNSFQRRCAADVTADYGSAADGNLRVVNRCERDDKTVETATGEARPVAGEAGKLKVRFAPQWLSWLPLVWGDYWVIEVDDDYRTALVGTPDREYLWLLSRVPQRSADDVDSWLQRAAALGFDTDRIVRTRQTADNPVSDPPAPPADAPVASAP